MENTNITYDETKNEVLITGEALIIFKGDINERIEYIKTELQNIEKEKEAQTEKELKFKTELETLSRLL